MLPFGKMRNESESVRFSKFKRNIILLYLAVAFITPLQIACRTDDPAAMNFNDSSGFAADSNPSGTYEYGGSPLSETPDEFVIQNIRVNWVEQSASMAETDEQGNTLHLAELIRGRSNAAKTGVYVSVNGERADCFYHFANESDTYAVFPTFSGQPGKHLNQAMIEVSFTKPIPADMNVTVHLHVFSPKIKKSQDSQELHLNKTSLVFTEKDNPASGAPPTKYVTATFREGFGDCFIVAALPAGVVAETYDFGIDDETLFPGVAVPDNMQTPVLYNAAWNGFKVPETWVFDAAAYTIATETLETIEVAGRSNGESHAKSVLRKSFSDDIDTKLTPMKLRLEYYFDRARDNVGAVLSTDTPCGYVLPDKYKNDPKISFVGNSGVKIGSTGAGVHEIQIIDVEALIAMGKQHVPNGNIGEIADFQFNENANPTSGVHYDRRTHAMKAEVLYGTPPLQKTLRFADEEVNTLMHGVAYGKAYIHMPDYCNVPDEDEPNTSGDSWGKYWHTLHSNLCHTTYNGNDFAMVITWTPTFTYVPHVGQLTVEINDSERYAESFDSRKFGDGHLYLQSHWGSGVVFTSASFSPAVEID